MQQAEADTVYLDHSAYLGYEAEEDGGQLIQDLVESHHILQVNQTDTEIDLAGDLQLPAEGGLKQLSSVEGYTDGQD